MKELIQTDIHNIVQLFDRVFHKLGQKVLFENLNFMPDKEMNAGFFLRFKSVEKKNRIFMLFEITNGGLSFCLDRASEIPEWSNEYIGQNPEAVAFELELLFSNPIQVDRQGKATTIRILKHNGQEIRTFKYSEGISLSWFRRKETKIYQPFFECVD